MAEATQDGRYTVGVDLGGTNIAVAVVDDVYTVMAGQKVPTDPRDGAEAVADRIAEAVGEVVGQAGVRADSIRGVGVGAPGPLDPESGVVSFAPNLNWHNVPLKSMLESRLSVPTFVENDVNVGTLGELRLGAGKGAKQLIGVFVGTGIGGGMVLDGELYRGANFSAGEVGHMIVKTGGPRCGCGNRGCWEAVASRQAIVRRLVRAFRRGARGPLYKMTKGAPSKIRSRALSRAFLDGDPLVIREMKREAKYLGMGVANLINLFSPQMVILGGGVVEAMGDWLIKRVRRSTRRYALAHALEGVDIVASALGDDAGILGCAVLANGRLSQMAES